MASLTPVTRLRNFAARPLVRNIVKVLSGNIFGNGLNYLTGIIIPLALTKPEFAVFGVLQQTFFFLFPSLSDFGLNTTMIKVYRDLETKGRGEDAEALMRRSLWIRMTIIGLVMGMGLVFAGPIARHWPAELALNGGGRAAALFRLACLSAVGASLWAFCQAAMQARQQFGLYALLTTANHALRFVLIGGLFWLGRLNLTLSLGVLMAVPFLGIVSSVRLWPRRFWAARMEPAAMRGQLVSIFHFSKWIFVSMIVVAFLGSLNILLLERLGSTEDLVQFNMALSLARGIPLIPAAITTVMLPKLAATRSRGEMKRILGLFIKLSPLLILAIGGVILMAHLVVPHLKGGAYTPALPIFDLFVVGMSLSVIGNPISFFCLAFDRAHWLAWMNIAQLLMTGMLGVVLIPHFGAIGAGVSELLWRVFGLMIILLAFRRLLKMAEA